MNAVVHCRRHPRAHPQPARHGLPEQPHGDVQRPRGRGSLRGLPLRERLERDGARVLLSGAPLPAGLRAGRRRPPHPAAGSLRAFEVLRRAAHGRRGAPLGPPLHLDPAVLGAARGQLRAQPGAAGARPLGPEPELLELHRRLRSGRRHRPGGAVRAARPRGLLHRLARQRRGTVPSRQMVRKYYGQPSFSASASSSSTTDAHCARIASGERSSPWVATSSASRYCRSSRRHHTSVSVTEER